MLKICRAKKITRELKQFDLYNTPLPYNDGFFKHAISCGVLHFFGNLAPIINETSRVIKPGGIFAFTVVTQTEGNENYTSRQLGGGTVFFHCDEYLRGLLREHHFDSLKVLTMLAPTGVSEISELPFKIYVTQKIGE